MVESDVNYRKFKGVEMRRFDPYGFWKINLPGLDSQSFTNVRQAYGAIQEFLNTHPEIETKKAEKIRK